MIIANPAKKEISIPLQPMTSAVSSSNLYPVEEAAAADLVTVNSRNEGLLIEYFFCSSSSVLTIFKNRHK